MLNTSLTGEAVLTAKPEMRISCERRCKTSGFW
jgi:hypothetical protein